MTHNPELSIMFKTARRYQLEAGWYHTEADYYRLQGDLRAASRQQRRAATVATLAMVLLFRLIAEGYRADLDPFLVEG